MMLTVTFAAKTLKDDRRDHRRPKRVQHMGGLVTPVTNPFTGRVLWVPTHCILNVVNGIAAVRIQATYSNRLRPLSPGLHELVNHYTGNTFLVHKSAITKERP